MWRIALVHAVFFSACLLPAQDTSPRVGQRVVTKYLTPLRLNKPVGSDAVFRVYTVERAEDGWLRLVAGDISGWVRAGDVVPFDQAIDFYNREIRARAPHSCIAYAARSWNHPAILSGVTSCKAEPNAA
jgi:hypothetical protein